VGAREIAAALESQGVLVPDRDVRLEHPLREVGDSRVKIHLRGDVFAEVLVRVLAAAKAV
jgi:ribosomal protein L9